MTRSYYSEVNDTLSKEGAKRIRQKILAYWHSRGVRNVEVNILEITTPSPHYAVRSNIVSLGLLGGVLPSNG